jgi:hypothetical protein
LRDSRRAGVGEGEADSSTLTTHNVGSECNESTLNIKDTALLYGKLLLFYVNLIIS